MDYTKHFQLRADVLPNLCHNFAFFFSRNVFNPETGQDRIQVAELVWKDIDPWDSGLRVEATLLVDETLGVDVQRLFEDLVRMGFRSNQSGTSNQLAAMEKHLADLRAIALHLENFREVKITAITCTFERPQALDLCHRYMRAQTRQPDQWLILDGPEPMPEKLIAAIEGGKIEGDAIIFFEDDDAFGPGWIAWCEKMLTKYELVGEGMAIYYNVRKRWWSACANHSHASLCQTAIRRELFETLCNVIRAHDNPWIDTQLWKIECDKMLVCPKTPADRRVIGIKGMPGKAGYSREHHKFDPRGCTRDPSLRKLFELIGPDAEAYKPFYQK